MNERDAFIKAIESDPEDKTVRLVFADWLDEHDEPELASKYRRLGWMNGDLSILRGLTISQIWRSDSRLIFKTNGTLYGYVSSEVEGDCCSESWYYAIRMSKLIGSKIIGSYEADYSWIDTDDGLCRQESDSCYAVGLLTEAGFGEVFYRCSSNGYYGGWMESGYADVIDLAGMVEVTSDWTAEKNDAK